MTTRRTMLHRLSLLLVAMTAPPIAFAAGPNGAQVRDFFRAVQLDDAATVRTMLSAGFDPNMLNPIGAEPALVLAVREGATRVLETLLAFPATRIDTPAANGNTALMMATFKGNRAAAEALLARGAAVNRPGWTPLHYAAAAGDNGIVGLLLERGAAIDAVSPPASGRYTPLMMAAREGHADTAAYLVRHGANPALKNGEGLTAAELAARARQ
jgi:ankyrin repeat protein